MHKNKKQRQLYDKVMPRFNYRNTIRLNNKALVTREKTPSDVQFGAKPSCSKTSVFCDLPTVLNDYVPEVESGKDKRATFVVKPKKTLSSHKPAERPFIFKIKENVAHKTNVNSSKLHGIRSGISAPTLTNSLQWSDTHIDQCLSSNSHSKHRELKDEIKAFDETQKNVQFRNKLYKKCGLVLDDVGQVAADKGVQVEPNVDLCKATWTKLRNCYTNAIKRRRVKKTGQPVKVMEPWRFEKQMSFLLPFMESRQTSTNVDSPGTIVPEISQFDSDISNQSPIELEPVQCKKRRHSSDGYRKNLDFMKPAQEERDFIVMTSEDEKNISYTKSLQEERLQQVDEIDETDQFFLCMSKSLKRLPRLDQVRIKLDLHKAIHDAEIRELERLESRDPVIHNIKLE